MEWNSIYENILWQCLLGTMALEDRLDNVSYGDGFVTTGAIRKAHGCWTSGKLVTLVPQGTSWFHHRSPSLPSLGAALSGRSWEGLLNDWAAWGAAAASVPWHRHPPSLLALYLSLLKSRYHHLNPDPLLFWFSFPWVGGRISLEVVAERQWANDSKYARQR